MSVLRRSRNKQKTPTENGKIIQEELSKRGISLTSWLENYGLDTKYQRTASDIIFGKIIGKNSTKTQTGGTVRALMLAMHYDFGVNWEWMLSASPQSISEYRRYLVKMSSSRHNNVRGYRAAYKTADFPSLLEKIKSDTKLINYGTERIQRFRLSTIFSTCVKYKICPICFSKAEYESVSKKINNRTGELARSKSVLTCTNEFEKCFDGNPMDKFCIKTLLVEKYPRQYRTECSHDLIAN